MIHCVNRPLICSETKESLGDDPEMILAVHKDARNVGFYAVHEQCCNESRNHDD